MIFIRDYIFPTDYNFSNMDNDTMNITNNYTDFYYTVYYTDFFFFTVNIPINNNIYNTNKIFINSDTDIITFLYEDSGVMVALETVDLLARVRLSQRETRNPSGSTVSPILLFSLEHH
jgi:hypothetical protein